MNALDEDDRELLYELVEWHEYAQRPWRSATDLAWRSLVDAGFVARAPDGHVYPLPRAIMWVRRSRAHRGLAERTPPAAT